MIHSETIELEDARPVLRIQASKGWVSLQLRDLWAYRELLYFLTWRDIKVRYKQTALGVAWAVIQPLFKMVVFSIIFGKLAKISSDRIPYPIFSFTALVPWGFFETGLSLSSNSLVSSANLITKIYFPRLIIPIATIMAGVIDTVIALIILIGMMIYYHVAQHVTYSPHLIYLPLFAVLALVTSLSVSLWLSALNVEYRDVRYGIPFLTQVWFYLTPITYPSSLLHEPWRTLYGINPMAGVVEGFRWALLGSGSAPGPMLIVSSSVAILLLVGGAFYFRRMEKTFADVV